jgi:hypothetical protein
MGALRAVVIITGENMVGNSVTMSGAHVQTLHFDPATLTVDRDGDSVPPRVVVRVAGDLSARIDVVANDLADAQADIVVLQDFRNNAEPYAVAGGLWGGGGNLPVTADHTAELGEYVRVDMTGKVAPDVVTITLPPATADNVGRAIKVAEISSGGVDNGAEMHIVIDGGQSFDAGLGATIVVANQVGSRWSFIAVRLSTGPDVYGYSVEGYDP